MMKPRIPLTDVAKEISNTNSEDCYKFHLAPINFFLFFFYTSIVYFGIPE